MEQHRCRTPKMILRKVTHFGSNIRFHSVSRVRNYSQMLKWLAHGIYGLQKLMKAINSLRAAENRLQDNYVKSVKKLSVITLYAMHIH